MALNVGNHFEQRWLDIPQAVRQIYLDDLARVGDLLAPQTKLSTWQVQEEKAQKEAQHKIKQAYASVKAQLIEDAQLRKRQVLENALAIKRQKQQQQSHALLADIDTQYQEDTQALYVLSQKLKTDTENYTARYQPVALSYPQSQESTPQLSSKLLNDVLENVQVRLELEAETLIEQVQGAIKSFNQNMTQATHEEIEIAIKQES